MPNSNYLTEEEKKKRQQQQQAQMSPYNPAMALNGNYMRQSASDVVNSWATPTPTTGATGTTPEAKKPTLSEQAINNYTNKVQSLYDYEAQQRASADANFQKSMRYLPQMFKQAGLYGSGQSESTLADMANKQRNTQNDISAETNKGINDLKEQYNADVENLDEQTKLQVDEVSNFISQRNWSNASKEDWDNFINYLKSADYSDDVINKAIKQIQAFNPDVGRFVGSFASGKDNDAYRTSKLKLYNVKGNVNTIAEGRDFWVEFNGKTYRMEGGNKVSDSMNNTLNEFAKQQGIDVSQKTSAGSILYYNGEIYILSEANGSWRIAREKGVFWKQLKNLKEDIKN